MKKHEFNLKEDSFLATFLRKHFIDRILGCAPKWMTPNLITFAAFFIVTLNAFSILICAVLFCFLSSNTKVVAGIFLHLIIYQVSILSRYKQMKTMVYERIGLTELALTIVAVSFFNLASMERFVLAALLVHGWFLVSKLIYNPIYYKGFYLYMVTTALLILALPDWEMFQILLFALPLSLHFSGKVIRSHLLDEPYPRPDLIAPLTVLILPIFSSSSAVYVGFPVCYLWAKVIVFYLYTGSYLKKT